MTKRRVIVLTDISTLYSTQGEPDDTQSLIRFLLYTNELDVEGLIATYTSHGHAVHPEYIHAVLDAYGQVEENLRRHDPAYPAQEALHAVVRAGNPVCGLDQLGPGHDTEGSEWIISVVDRADDRPVWVLLWGGPLDLAQAVWKVCHTRSAEEAARFKARLRVYAIADQYDGSGPWLRQNHPDIFYITSVATFRGMYRGGETQLLTPSWVRGNICEGHGALGGIYPVYEGGDPWGRVSGIKEGDTPSFLYLVDPGHGDPEDPEAGNWGGRFIRKGRQFFDLPDPQQARDSVAIWRSEFQNDFQRRMDWCME
ncbi:MAG: DUF1593 domain-containing protein [Clostridia bacterium]|nr:DUF1593 domain-containing protein [Clostridia bacterium]